MTAGGVYGTPARPFRRAGGKRRLRARSGERARDTAKTSGVTATEGESSLSKRTHHERIMTISRVLLGSWRKTFRFMPERRGNKVSTHYGASADMTARSQAKPWLASGSI